MMIIAMALLGSLAAYAGIGLLFAVLFVTRGVAVVDPAARQASIWVRLLLLPGSLALWPWLAWRWRRAAGAPAEPHP